MIAARISANPLSPYFNVVARGSSNRRAKGEGGEDGPGAYWSGA